MDARPEAGPTRIVDLLDLADRTIEACLARTTDASGLTREQWRTLVMLDERTRTGGPDGSGHTMGEIAVRVCVPAPTATRVVDKLVADGLAFRRSDPWDRRRVLVHVSPAGHDLVGTVADDLDALLEPALAGLRADRVGVLALLDRLTVALACRATADVHGERMPRP